MSFAKSPLRRGRIGRAAHTRFVEVEMPAVATCPLVVELVGGDRILVSDTTHIGLAARLLAEIAGHQEGGRP